MSTIRPAGSGHPGTASPFMRSIASPRAGLVIVAAVAPPGDWPASDGEVEANLSHAAGWTCEVRRDDILLVDPLGEGVVRAPLPNFGEAWLENVRHDRSCALYLAPPDTDAGFAELTMASAANIGALRGATVRTSIAADFGASDPVGRNQPCPC
ncbi:MAG: hypothetical protein GY773_31435, partial [Actinomycetia bacterium]|nr:hypothetical protein [Actinomycetes bacterium]